MGKPAFPIAIVTQLGIVPRVQYERADANTKFSAGLGVDALVPFIDFN